MRRELDPPGRTSPIRQWVYPLGGVLLFSLYALPPLLEQQLIGVPDWQVLTGALTVGGAIAIGLAHWTDHPGTRVLLAGIFGSLLYRFGSAFLVGFEPELKLSTLAVAEIASVTVAAAALGWLAAEWATSSDESAGETSG